MLINYITLPAPYTNAVSQVFLTVTSCIVLRLSLWSKKSQRSIYWFFINSYWITQTISTLSFGSIDVHLTLQTCNLFFPHLSFLRDVLPDGGAAGQTSAAAAWVQEETSGPHRHVELRCKGQSLSVKRSKLCGNDRSDVAEQRYHQFTTPKNNAYNKDYTNDFL